MTEDYISFETAKLLKEKGFYIEKVAAFDLNGIFYWPNWLNQSGYPAPTQSLVVKWLRVKHNIYIYAPVVIAFNEDKEDYLESQGFQYWISYFNNKKYCQARSQASIESYPTPEQAIEAAIVYSLKHLI